MPPPSDRRAPPTVASPAMHTLAVGRTLGAPRTRQARLVASTWTDLLRRRDIKVMTDHLHL